MAVERTPERRRKVNFGLLLGALIIAIVILGVLIALFTGTLDPLLGRGESDRIFGQPPPTVEPAGVPANTPTPALTPTPEPTGMTEPVVQPKVIPEVSFGEVSQEGWVDVELPDGSIVETWFTFQVDTTTREITLLFAVYNDGNTLASTVKTERYVQGSPLDNAEVMLFFPAAPERVISFNGLDGTVTETQIYNFQPFEPSIFSPGVRSNLVYYELALRTESGDTTVDLDSDLSGLLGREALFLEKSDPVLVNRALNELGALIQQIENKRAQTTG